MPFQSCPNMVSIAIQGESNGKQIANILHGRFPSLPGAADITALGGLIYSNVVANYPPLMSANLIFNQVTVTGLTVLNDIQSVSTGTPSPGTASGDPLPGNNSLVCTLRSVNIGKSARGRIYTWATGTTNLSATGGDLYDAAYVAAVQAFWSGLNGDFITAGFEWVILSRFTANAARPTGVGFPVVSWAMRNSTNDSQRRRLPKGH